MSERIIHVKSSVERKPEFRQQTLIIRDGERLFARKIPVGEAAKAHVAGYAANCLRLSEALRPGARIRPIGCSENGDGSVDFPFCDAPTLLEMLSREDTDGYIRRVLALRNALREAFGQTEYTESAGFTEIFGNVPFPTGTEALAVTNADLNFDNFFIEHADNPAEEQYILIDYEWILPFPIPLGYLIYRALLLDPAFAGRTEEEKRKILDALEIGGDREKTYQEMELAFLRWVSPEEYKLDYFARIPEARTTVEHDLNRLLALPEENRALFEELCKARYYEGRWWFKIFRKINDGLHVVRDGIRRFARQENVIGRTCSFVLTMKREGASAAWRKVVLQRRAWRKARRREQQYIRKLNEEARTASAPEPEEILISLLVPLYNTPRDFLREMIASVQAQSYSRWELCMADGSDGEHAYVGEECLRLAAADPRILYRKLEHNGGISENTNACIDMATGDYIALFDHDDLLMPDALAENIKAIREQGADFLYSDELVFLSPDRNRVLSTHFKPDWSPESLLSNNYICHLSVFKASLLEKAGRFRRAYDGSQDHDLILRLTDCAEKVVHLPKVLYLWRAHPASTASSVGKKSYAITAGRRAVRDFVRTRKHLDAEVESTAEHPTMYHVRYPIEGDPLISAVLDLTGLETEERKKRILALWESRDGERVQILAIRDGEGDRLPADLPVKWIQRREETRCVRLRRAAEAADGDWLVFVDAELEYLNKGWMTNMLMQAQRDGIGAVGGLVLFADGSFRHAGLVTGMGRKHIVGRSHFRYVLDDLGYCGQLVITGDVSAVSTEAMLVRRDLYEQAGGFCEEYQDTLFDVDLCLRLRQAGRRNLYTPTAKFRGGKPGRYSADYGTEWPHYAEDGAVFARKWQDVLGRTDPYYNPNLTLDGADYTIRV